MPRTASTSIPGYRKHRASGQAVVTISGVDHYLGPHGTKVSRVEYDRLISEWMAAGRPAFLVTSADLSIAELCQRYKAFAESYYIPGGGVASIKTALRCLREIYGKTLAAEFGPLAFKSIRARFVAAGNSRTYCNRLTDTIRRMFKWAASEQLVATSTWQSLTTVTGLRRGHTDAHDNEPITPIDDAIVEITLPYLPGTVADMVRLQRLTGMRPGDICRLRPCEVNRSQEVWSYRPSNHKTAHHGHIRIVFIGPKGQEVLRPYLLREADAYCFVPAEVAAKQLALRHARRKTPLSCGNIPGSNRIRRKPKRTAGQKYTRDSYRRAIHRGCDRADLVAHQQQPDVPAEARIVPRWSPNRLRHTAGTEIRKKYGLEAAQVVLGHRRADVTQIYADRDLAKAAAVIREVG